jgi:hypothetical protein
VEAVGVLPEHGHDVERRAAEDQLPLGVAEEGTALAFAAADCPVRV